MGSGAQHEVLPTTAVGLGCRRSSPKFERGVIVPWKLWLEILPAIEDHLDTTEARHRLEVAGTRRIGFDEAAAAVGRNPGRYR